MEELLPGRQCPNCARFLYFKNSETNLIACDCGKVITRERGELSVKSYDIVKIPATVIQPGTTGMWQDKSFLVLGRIRAWMETAVYNYWSITFQDETHGYLCEGYGSYGILREIHAEEELTLAKLQSYETGKEYVFAAGAKYTLQQKNACKKWELEGEAFIPAVTPKFTSFEFASTDGKHFEALAFGENVTTWQINYSSFEEFLFKNTRAWEHAGKNITCLKCSRQNLIKTFPLAQSYSCNHCGAWYAILETDYFSLLNERNAVPGEPAISMGATGVIGDFSYEIVGFVIKNENNVGNAEWREYTLFNPENGFATLSEYNGNWIFVKEKGNTPVLKNERVKEFSYGDEPFHLFNRYSYNIRSARGEFPYNGFGDPENNKNLEYISPPEMWIYERDRKDNIHWFHGEHINPQQQKSAFGDQINLPVKHGVGAVEPKFAVSPEKIVVATLVAIILLFIFHKASSYESQNKVLLQETYYFDSLAEKSVVTSQFKLTRRNATLQFDIQAPVNNSWFEFDATLVNAITGAEFSFEKGVEYYHGVSEGESWSEGTTMETAYLNDVPAGTYYLQINGIRESAKDANGFIAPGAADRFWVSLTYDPEHLHNFVVVMFMVLGAGLIQFLVVRHFENKRWSESPFGPSDY